MDQEKPSGFDEKALGPHSLITKSTMVYGAMVVVGLVSMSWGHHSLGSILGPRLTFHEGLRLLAIGGLAAGLLHILSFFFEDWFGSYRDLKVFVMRILGPLSAVQAVYLALITALGEELVFRGAIQPVAGLVVTSFLFGLMHVGPGGLLSAWSLWAMLSGGLLGWMYLETGLLWPSILAHFVVNVVSIMNLRRLYRQWLASMDLGPKAPHEGSSGLDKQRESRP